MSSSRISSNRLGFEARQYRVIQRSFHNWAAAVEQERQLLFEALAYLHDDLQIIQPDIKKIQSDTARLRDFLLYKIENVDEEINDLKRFDTKDDADIQDGASLDHQICKSSSDIRSSNGCNNEKILMIHPELTEVEVNQMLATTEEVRIKMEQSESEAASHIGKIVAEKESLKSDRDLLMSQLENSSRELAGCNQKINRLEQELADATSTNVRAVKDLSAQLEKSAEKEKDLSEGYEHAADQIFQLTNELDRATDEISTTLQANESLRSTVMALESMMCSERAGREKERDTLKAAFKGIDNLTAQVADLKQAPTRDGKSVEAFSRLEREMQIAQFDNTALREIAAQSRRELSIKNDDCQKHLQAIDKLRQEIESSKSGDGSSSLAEEVVRLQRQLGLAAHCAAEAELVASVRVASCQKEIDCLAANLLVERLSAKEKDDILSRQETEVSALRRKAEVLEEIEVKEKEEEKEKSSSEADHAIESAAMSELVRTLQANRALALELDACRAKLKQEEAKCLALESNPSSLSAQSKQIADTIEASKDTLCRAAAQVDSVRSQVREGEKKLFAAESQVTSLRAALSDAIMAGKREIALKANLQSQLNFKSAGTGGPGPRAEERKSKVVVPFTSYSSAFIASVSLRSDDHMASLLEELERMTQLKEMAETKAAALSLVGSGTRILEQVQQMTLKVQSANNSSISSPRNIGGAESTQSFAGFFSTSPIPSDRTHCSPSPTPIDSAEVEVPDTLPTAEEVFSSHQLSSSSDSAPHVSRSVSLYAQPSVDPLPHSGIL